MKTYFVTFKIGPVDSNTTTPHLAKFLMHFVYYLDYGRAEMLISLSL